MKYLFLLGLVLFTSSYDRLCAQEDNSNLNLGLGVNAGFLKSSVLGIAPQSYYGLHVSAMPHPRIFVELSLAHASTRTEAPVRALSFIGAPKRNFQSNAIDLVGQYKCFSLNQNVSLYAGLGLNHVSSNFLYLGRVVHGGRSPLDGIIAVEQEEVSGDRTATIGSLALRSSPHSQWQVCVFGNMGIFASRPERSSMDFTEVFEGGSFGSTYTPGPTRYVRAGVEVTYRIL